MATQVLHPLPDTVATQDRAVTLDIQASVVTPVILELAATAATLDHRAIPVTQAILEFLGTQVTLDIQAPPATPVTQDQVATLA